MSNCQLRNTPGRCFATRPYLDLPGADLTAPLGHTKGYPKKWVDSQHPALWSSLRGTNLWFYNILQLSRQPEIFMTLSHTQVWQTRAALTQWKFNTRSSPGTTISREFSTHYPNIVLGSPRCWKGWKNGVIWSNMVLLINSNSQSNQLPSANPFILILNPPINKHGR